ncbi:MAG: thiosulfate/3-mercaptopyruvate sulfurtransferase [Myxococcota bacterium]|jgi:thiosulfate/3-mercaptopyruvate sulfurtransferase
MLWTLIACGTFIVGADVDAWGDRIVSDVGQLPVVDARTAEDWQVGHISGASQVHWTELTGMDDAELWGVLPAEELAARFSERGIPSAAPVVVYGSGPSGYGDDGNVYWALRYLGHTQVRVLNGGWPGWLATGQVTTDADDAPDPVEFIAEVNVDVLATTQQVEDFTGVLLDVRSEEEWLGGHIPGAIWMEWTEVYDGALTLRSEAELRDLFADLGITETTPVIVYCAGGIRAGHTFMVLEALGYADVRNYVGSWSRWIAESGEVEVP